MPKHKILIFIFSVFISSLLFSLEHEKRQTIAHLRRPIIILTAYSEQVREKMEYNHIGSTFPSSDKTQSGCSVCMWRSTSQPAFKHDNTVQFSDTCLTHANICAAEWFRDREMQHVPQHKKHSSLLQSLPITPKRFHTNLIWDVESQAWVCILSSHFAILVGLWRFVSVVNKKLLPVDVSSYPKERSWQSSGKITGGTLNL